MWVYLGEAERGVGQSGRPERKRRVLGASFSIAGKCFQPVTLLIDLLVSLPVSLFVDLCVHLLVEKLGNLLLNPTRTSQRWTMRARGAAASLGREEEVNA